MKLVNPFDVSGKWFKANLHTHTTTSDGQLPPAQRIEQYRSAGYDVLALTDHWATNDLSGVSDDKFLAISGIEVHPPCPSRPAQSYHIVGLGVPRDFAVRSRDNAQQCIDDVTAVGGLAFLAHPYWCGHCLTDFEHLRGLSAVEVWNSTCDKSGRGSSEHEWANLLDTGRLLPCVGVDDAHQAEAGEEVFECWTMLKMPQLTLDAVLEAVKAGCCFVSRGPEIHDFRVADGRVSIKCSPARSIYFISGPTNGRRARAIQGMPLTSFEIEIPQRWTSYARAVVIGEDGRQAWTNPVPLEKKP